MKKLKFNFTIMEFLVEREDVDVSVVLADKILKHIEVLQPIRDRLNAPLQISQHSGYRSIQWERKHNRSGLSEHTFVGKGAVDLYTQDMEYLRQLITESEYTRVCYYPLEGHLHADFKYVVGEVQKHYLADPEDNSRWVQVRKDQFIKGNF